MCYHYSLTKKMQEVMKMMVAEWETPFEPVYHAIGFEFAPMPVITARYPEKIQPYHWGLIPHWCKTLAEAQKIRTQTLNAKSETLFEKPSFRNYTDNRCLVLADGFFEWMEFKGKKYPHFVRMSDASLFAFAGLFAHWTDRETGELFRTFTIITTEANPLMARIHNIKKRMPVILQQHHWKQWLDPNLSKEQVLSLLTPCDDTAMKAHTISRLITTRGADTNVPELLEPFDYPELNSTEQNTLFDA